MLRTDHLATDWPQIDVMLGGALPGHRWPATHARAGPTANQGQNPRHLTPRAIANLCHALKRELTVYTTIVISAANLTPKEKLSTLQTTTCLKF